MKLRPYQKKAIREFKKQTRGGRIIIIYPPIGAGKTIFLQQEGRVKR